MHATPDNTQAASPVHALRRAKRIDRMLRRESCGIFRNLRQLVTTPGYTPTLRVPELADAYAAAQAARDDPRKACR